MSSRKTITVALSTKHYRKVQEFSIKNFVSVSEIFRVLFTNTKIKINIKDKKTVIAESRQEKNIANKNTNSVLLVLNAEIIDKINEMRFENNTTISEIAKHLVENADFSKLKFKTIGEINSEARLKVLNKKKMKK